MMATCAAAVRELNRQPERQSVPRAATASHAVEPDEEILLQRIEAGDAGAFHELVSPLERGVFLAAFSIVKNEADAEDVAQEAVLKAFRNLASFRRESKFSTWLIQIVMNEARMKLRKERRQLFDAIDEEQQTEDGSYMPREFADWREIPSEALERKELREALSRAMHSLPEKYRTVLMLRDVQQLSISETAKVLGINEANVKTRLSRARQQMRDALAPRFDASWRTQRRFDTAAPLGSRSMLPRTRCE